MHICMYVGDGREPPCDVLARRQTQTVDPGASTPFQFQFVCSQLM